MAASLRCHTKFLNCTNHIGDRCWHSLYLALHTLRQATRRKHAGPRLLKMPFRKIPVSFVGKMDGPIDHVRSTGQHRSRNLRI